MTRGRLLTIAAGSGSSRGPHAAQGGVSFFPAFVRRSSIRSEYEPGRELAARCRKLLQERASRGAASANHTNVAKHRSTSEPG